MNDGNPTGNPSIPTGAAGNILYSISPLSSMEEKREIIYSDISSASRKRPYDAMVYSQLPPVLTGGS